MQPWTDSCSMGGQALGPLQGGKQAGNAGAAEPGGSTVTRHSGKQETDMQPESSVVHLAVPHRAVCQCPLTLQTAGPQPLQLRRPASRPRRAQLPQLTSPFPQHLLMHCHQLWTLFAPLWLLRSLPLQWQQPTILLGWRPDCVWHAGVCGCRWPILSPPPCTNTPETVNGPLRTR